MNIKYLSLLGKNFPNVMGAVLEKDVFSWHILRQWEEAEWQGLQCPEIDFCLACAFTQK